MANRNDKLHHEPDNALKDPNVNLVRLICVLEEINNSILILAEAQGFKDESSVASLAAIIKQAREKLKASTTVPPVAP